MLERDKNHPSVIIWSLGNGGGSGSNLSAMREAMAAIDPTRVYFYHADHSVSDMYDANYNLTYTFNAHGRLKVEADCAPGKGDIPLIPKFGMRLAIPEQYSNIKWYGREPHENYQDLKRSAFYGVYEKPE